jgi:radical SAM superfamily enzyme YgiQ (UPF0313 family)
VSIRLLIIDALTAGEGKRIYTRDFIGAGPRTVAGFIEMVSDNRIQSTIMRAEDFLGQMDTKLCEQYQILGISAMTMDEKITMKVVQRWKLVNTNTKKTLILLGGPITADLNILKRIPIDVICIGEAEISLYALFHTNFEKLQKYFEMNDNSSKIITKSELLSNIPGIAFQNNNEIIYQKREQFDRIWFINSPGFPEKISTYSDYNQARIYVECVRGCSNFRRTSLVLQNQKICLSSKLDISQKGCAVCRKNILNPLLQCPVDIPPGCGFCSTIESFGSPRSRSIDAILREIQILIELGAHRIVLGGPDFLDFQRDSSAHTPLINPNEPEPNYAALQQLISGLLNIPEIKEHTVQLFIENVKASLCTDRALDLITRIPHANFSIGCETGSNRFANELGRPSNPQITLTAVKKAHARQIRVHVYFIHSLPGDKPEYIQETLHLMEKFAQLGVEKITLYKYQELPGSPFYRSPLAQEPPSREVQKWTEKLKRYVIQYNGQQKNWWLNKTVRVFITEPNTQSKGDAIGWILEGGPKVSVKSGKIFIGQWQNVKVIRVISDRLVEAEIIRS